MSIDQLYEAKEELRKRWDGTQKLGERLDSIRLTLEPFVYQTLCERYSGRLNAFWRTYIPPKVAKYAFAVIERRLHPNYWFILRNMAWAGPHMSVYLFCSDINEPFIRAMLGDKAPYFNICPVFQGNPSRERGKKEVDNLLSDWRTYNSIQAEYILTVEMDTFLRKKIPDQLFQGDYWGCPWAWKANSPGGGGLTVRKISAMVELCKANRPDTTIDLHMSQDCWLADTVQSQGGKFPPFEERRKLLMENSPVISPVGVHQFWTFACNHTFKTPDEYRAYLSHILTLEGLV